MMALLAMMAVLFGTTACGGSIFGQTRIKGSGNLITRTVAVGNFHTIDASRGVKVLLTDEPGDIEICADDNLIEYVRVGIDGGELKITVAPRIHAVPSEQILVRVPSWCAYLTTEISANWRLPPLRRSWPRHSLPAECWRSRRRAQPGSVWMHRSKRVKSTLRAALKSWRRSMRTVWKRMLRAHRRFCCRVRYRKRCSKPLPLRRSMPGSWSHTSARRRRRAPPIFGSIASRLCNPERRAPEAFPMPDRAV